MKVLFDTCAAVDILGKSNWFFDAFCSYDIALLRGFSPCLSVSSTTDICYLLHARGFTTKKRARQLMANALNLFELVDNIGADCTKACASDMPDYEDALIAHSAHRVGVDLIVTRNKKDFSRSPVAAVTPEEFLRNYKPANIEYGKVEFES